MPRCPYRLLLLCLLPLAVQGVELGRLFTTPAQRERMDAIRHGEAAAAITTTPARVHFDGLVRSARHQWGWVDGRLLPDRQPRQGPRLLPDGRLRIPAASGGPRLLKPGQYYDRMSDSLLDAYESAHNALAQPAPAAQASGNRKVEAGAAKEMHHEPD